MWGWVHTSPYLLLSAREHLSLHTPPLPILLASLALSAARKWKVATWAGAVVETRWPRSAIQESALLSFFCILMLYSGNSIHPLLMPFCAQHWLPQARVGKKRVEHLLRCHTARICTLHTAYLHVSHCTVGLGDINTKLKNLSWMTRLTCFSM